MSDDFESESESRLAVVELVCVGVSTIRSHKTNNKRTSIRK